MKKISKKKCIVFSDSYNGIKKILKSKKYNVRKIKTFSPYVSIKYKNDPRVIYPLNKEKIEKINFLKKNTVK